MNKKDMDVFFHSLPHQPAPAVREGHTEVQVALASRGYSLGLIGDTSDWNANK